MGADASNVVVFRGNPAEAELVRGLLDEAGIRAFLEDDNMGTTLPAVLSAGGVAAVKVVVAPEDAERARGEIANALARDETDTEEGWEFSAT